MVFFEKADSEIIKECQKFISENQDKENDYYCYHESLYLASRLIDSLLNSHKEYDDVIRKKCQQYNELENQIKKEVFATSFNNQEYTLVLDLEAHSVLDILNDIQNKNRKNL